ncbi:MAG: DNA-3-methyladenine glycosylase I [Alphaproteobacteria bacterium]|nr:DNA-3-methyladenine glycosylase I [Alphaproteobacteria bacterium]MCB9928528.1 DNA-3-methyladenine glycosylase I [Alphaproteobacteria bacterium]
MQPLHRCPWAGDDPQYQRYHDTEWGVPQFDDRALFEKIVLEGFQAGLSWITILRKRENFRAAFDGFRPDVIASYDATKQAALLADAGIIRNRAKIAATVTNAQAWLALMERGSFADLVWGFVDGRPQQNAWRSMAEVPAETPASKALAKELKRLGFRFCGPTTCYAFMQAMGLVNDHLVSCPRHAEVAALA